MELLYLLNERLIRLLSFYVFVMDLCNCFLWLFYLFSFYFDDKVSNTYRESIFQST